MHCIEEAAPALLGVSEQAQELRRTIRLVADVPAHALIAGATGTGKELIARCLHAGSPSSGGDFVPVSCRAILPEGLEAEIFGCSRADRSDGSRPGKIDLAQHGTLFLQDVECLPLPIQAKLARALQEGGSRRSRSNEPIRADLRVVASTTADIEDLCDRGEFLFELYWCVSTVRIVTSPLRDMREDIPVLFEAFLAQAAARYRRPVPSGHLDVLPELIGRAWPGNADELRNAADRFVLGAGLAARPVPKSLPEQVDSFEKQLILHHLGRQRGSVSAASEDLSIPKTTLYDKLHKYGICPDAFR